MRYLPYGLLISLPYTGRRGSIKEYVIVCIAVKESAVIFFCFYYVISSKLDKSSSVVISYKCGGTCADMTSKIKI